MVQVIGGMSHLANNAITCLCHRQFLFTLPSNPHRNKSQYSRRLLPYITRANSPDEEYSSPDWEREMSIFKKRTMKPSQLEALRRFEEKKVDVGRVLYCEDSIAIIEGLNNDADVGTALSFASGAKGVLLWRRNDNIVFALLLGGSHLVNIGDGVECRVRGIIQLLDESEGPTTKRDYEHTLVPVGEALRGQIIDFLGRPLDADGTLTPHRGQIGTSAQLPMLNTQPDMESREQITESLITGVKALDILTPLGRGQALQVSGPQGSGKTQLCIDAVVGQKGAGVRCIYAAVGCLPDQLQRTVSQLQEHGCMEYTTVVAATEDRPLGEQYAAMLTACSIAEGTRDVGGHALVVLNDVGVMVRMWERIAAAMADLGSVAEAAAAAEVAEIAEQTVAVAQEMSLLDPGEGTLRKQDEEKDQGTIDATIGNSSSSSSQNENSPVIDPGSMDKEESGEGGLVEYEGMLVSVAAAQRRRFFSSLIQRCAKMHRRLRGGTMTSLLVVPGEPATGTARTAREKILAYKHLSQEQKEKLLRALDTQEQERQQENYSKMMTSTSSSSLDSKTEQQKQKQLPSAPHELRTEVIEEFMSITDGQIVLKPNRDPPTGGVSVNPQLSVSRIGSRAYPPVMAELAPLVRFELAQAEDAKKFGGGTSTGSAESLSSQDDATLKAVKRAAVISAALPQPQRTVCPLQHQVVQLIALQKGLLDDVAIEEVAVKLDAITKQVIKLCPDAVKEIATTKRLTGTARTAIDAALNASRSTILELEV